MNTTLYRSVTTGGTERIQTYEAWRAEAKEFYDLLYDYDFPVLMPEDWWRRWVKVLNITKLEVI